MSKLDEIVEKICDFEDAIIHLNFTKGLLIVRRNV
jgi:hypothetical protein